MMVERCAPGVDYRLLVIGNKLVAAARRLAGRTLLIDEFLAREARHGRITAAAFKSAPRRTPNRRTSV